MASTGHTEFPSGAYRDGQEGKLDYEGHISPLALQAYAEYMHNARYRPDGTVRESDNWQLGIPISSYVKSLLRHVMDVWLWQRGGNNEEPIKAALCGTIFNAMGMLHELVKEENVYVQFDDDGNLYKEAEDYTWVWNHEKQQWECVGPIYTVTDETGASTTKPL